MPIFLAHIFAASAVAYAISRRLVAGRIDQLITAALLFWTNVVASCLLLSAIGHLNDPAWLLRVTLLLALIALFVLRRFMPGEPVSVDARDDAPHLLLLLGAGLTLIPFLAGHVAIAATYAPNNYDSLTYHLPRSLYYLGHNSLAHFETADFRQVYYPLNFNLLQLLGFAYAAPAQVVTFFNVAAWIIAGLAVYRIARLCSCSANASLVAAWLAVTSLEVLAQATSTILDLPCGAALVAGVVFALRWHRTHSRRDALIAGIGVSMCLGTKLTAVFFLPAVALLLLAIACQHWVRREMPGFLRGVAAWILPALLAIPLGASFILYNYRATGLLMTHRMDFTLNKPFELGCVWQTTKAYLVQICVDPFCRFTFDIDQINAVNQWFSHYVFGAWNPDYAFSPLYTVPPDLNEDHVFFGFAGPLFLICGLICIWRDLRLRRPVTWIAFAGIGWFLAYFAYNKWSVYNQRYFIPPMILLAPCVAAVLDNGWLGSGFLIRIKRWVFGLIAISAAWCAGYYLLHNTIRPVPVPGITRPDTVPSLPPALAERLILYPKINLDSYGTNERVFPLMQVAPTHRFTSGRRIDPDRYHLFSFWKATRNYIFSNLEYTASYTVVPFPTKATAGVEFLGTVEEKLADSFDYVGYPPHANDLSATSANRNVVVIVEYNANARDPVRLGNANYRVVGLNPRDGAIARISAEFADGARDPVLELSHHDWTQATIRRPFRRLVIEIVDAASGRVVAEGELPFTARQSDFVAGPPISRDTIFTSELVSDAAVHNIAVTGLASIEGPYPQWDLPRFRWAKQATVRVNVPANVKLRILRVTFSARLQVRDDAVLELLHNGVPVRRFGLLGRHEWVTETVDIPATPGENIIEFADRSDGDLPDWLAYLDQNPDVKKFVASQNQTPEAGAKQHYETHGRAEGRHLPMRPNSTAGGAPLDSLYFAYRSLRIDGLSGQ